MRFLALLILITLGSVITLLRGKQNKQPLKKQFVTWPSENHTSHFHHGGYNEVPVQNNKSPHPKSAVAANFTTPWHSAPEEYCKILGGRGVPLWLWNPYSIYIRPSSAAFCTLYQTKDQQSLPCPRLAIFQKLGHYNKTKQNLPRVLKTTTKTRFFRSNSRKPSLDKILQTSNWPVPWKMIPYTRQKLSDFYAIPD